ncbi:MAG: hypothetical protein KatS3mg089_0591 [Patescibacteria group bacterium]|nr:MAG: hypothetical protein KatS3mg089_0591 [Patescibacteria group bacterium]
MRPDIYKPTLKDQDRIKPQFDKLKVSGDGVFATLQGEGITAGLALCSCVFTTII